jgi:hypothetical protein
LTSGQEVLPKDMVIIVTIRSSVVRSFMAPYPHTHPYPSTQKSQTIMTVNTNIDQDDEAMEALPPRDKPFA